MCDDHVDHWMHSEHKARTWKKCSECRGLIAPGDRYVRLVSINDGTAESFNMHTPCDDLADEVARAIGDDGCRMLMNRAIEWEIGEAGYMRDCKPWERLLRWMRVNSRFRFAKALGESWKEVRP